MEKKKEVCVNKLHHGSINFSFIGIAGDLAILFCNDCYEYIITPFERWGA